MKAVPWRERFWPKVDKSAGPDGCWIWTASKAAFGYGQFNITPRKPDRAHRIAWILANGEIPEGQCVLHRCDNPPCVNPAHLFLGSKTDNNRDMTAKGRHGMAAKTHCPRQHEYTPENTFINTRGSRECRTCNRINGRITMAAIRRRKKERATQAA